MLVLSRKLTDPPVICTCRCGKQLEVSVSEIKRDKVRLGFEAIKEDFVVHRAEVQEQIDAGNAKPKPSA